MRVFGFILLALSLTACGTGYGRPGFSDGPTVGGVWPEGGLMEGRADSGYSLDRGPAGNMMDSDGRRSWISQAQDEQNLRDRYRDAPSTQDYASMAPPVQRKYRRARREDFVDNKPNEGSLWASNGQTNYFFTKNRIRATGDLLSIEIEDQFVSDAAMELRTTLDEEEAEVELETAQKKLTAEAAEKQAKAGGGETGGDKGDKKKKKPELDVRDATWNDINVKDQMSLKPGEKLMAEIVERYPNGNYKVRGMKRVNYRGTLRWMTVMAIARGKDVDDQDLIKSSKLYEYRIKMYR